MARKIILDTNFLLIPGQFGVDIFSEFDRMCDFKYELVVVPETLIELEGILKGKSSKKDKMAAGLGLQLMKRHKVKALKYRKLFKRADEAIISVAAKNSFVATQDGGLRKRLKNRSGAIILRKKQYLEFFA